MMGLSSIYVDRGTFLGRSQVTVLFLLDSGLLTNIAECLPRMTSYLSI